jgi:hypothetical protein
MNTTITKSTPKQTDTEFETQGKYGLARIICKKEGQRTVEIVWKDKRHLLVDSNQVDLTSSKCKDLSKALEKACQETNFLPIFIKEEIKGPKALINIFYRPTRPSQGYATLSKPKKKTLKFALSRVNLRKMGEKTPKAALQKVAFVTGKINLLT